MTSFLQSVETFRWIGVGMLYNFGLFCSISGAVHTIQHFVTVGVNNLDLVELSDLDTVRFSGLDTV